MITNGSHPYLKESYYHFGSISGQRAEAKAARTATKGAVHAWAEAGAAGAWGQLNERYWRNYHGIALGRDYGESCDVGPVMVRNA